MAFDPPKLSTIPTSSPENKRDWKEEVIASMEQGVVVWSGTGECVMHNVRIYDVLEITPSNLEIGTKRENFLEFGVTRGEFSKDAMKTAQERFDLGLPFQFDRQLPSGRMVATNVRPLREGGSVVTFTDVTNARRSATDLEIAKTKAEEAEEKTRIALSQQANHQTIVKFLGELDGWLATCKSLNELFVIVSTFMEYTLPHSMGELYIYSNSRDVLDGACGWGNTELHDHITPDSCWALRRGRSYKFSTEKLSFHCDHVLDQGHTRDCDDFICVPIVAHGETVGLLHIRFSQASHSATKVSDSYRFARQCGEHISLAVANVQLRDELRNQSTKDALTGLYNRRYFLESMHAELARAQRTDGEFSIISFDADKFKSYNDNHGHDAGDLVLRAISTRLSEILTKGEVLCRTGGEEFSVILPETGMETAAEVAQELRMAVENLKIRYEGKTLPTVTISSGVATYPQSGERLQEIIKRADEALYKAKANGRNQVCLADNLEQG